MPSRERTQNEDPRRSAVIGRAQIAETFLDILDSTNVTARRNRDASRIRHFLYKQRIGAGILRFQRCDGAGVTVTDYDHIGFVVPDFRLPARAESKFVYDIPTACTPARIADLTAKLDLLFDIDFGLNHGDLHIQTPIDHFERIGLERNNNRRSHCVAGSYVKPTLMEWTFYDTIDNDAV